MKTIRWHLVIIIAVFLVLLGIGSSLDLTIAQGIYSESGTPARAFAATVSAFSPLLHYAIFPIFSGILLYLTMKFAFKTPATVAFSILMVITFAAGVYFGGMDFFSINGYNIPDLNWVGYIISTISCAGFMVLGFFMGRKMRNPKLWIIGLIIIGGLILALLIGTVVLKSIMHRPRFRYVVLYDTNKFFPWWKRCPNYKELLDYMNATYGLNITSEEFKSFPSGHVSSAANTFILVSMLPLLGDKYRKWLVPGLYISLAWTLMIAISRMLVGAHYLSDVSMGGLVTLIVFFIENELITRIPFLQDVLHNKSGVERQRRWIKDL